MLAGGAFCQTGSVGYLFCLIFSILLNLIVENLAFSKLLLKLYVLIRPLK